MNGVFGVTNGIVVTDSVMEPRDDKRDERKAYVAPKLLRLGSVRDLTFGTSIHPKTDGALTRAADK